MVVIRLSLSAFSSGEHKSSGRCRFQRWRRYNIPWRKLRAEGAAINQTIGIPSSVASTTHGSHTNNIQPALQCWIEIFSGFLVCRMSIPDQRNGQLSNSSQTQLPAPFQESSDVLLISISLELEKKG
ncbi:hypothetical protein OPV22_015518 [Ensete ventricosum]|uniref:Uncharacterized protein n=1 Tax=Ensete ventricosum TaxID=4639 RepID=A0AAV8RDW1_ENSVE|nr:hypothetical protein OPV22_015518 [Ensete ventricosum]